MKQGGPRRPVGAHTNTFRQSGEPPYNTGGDFRYNDKWDKDPNDPDLGDFVGSDDPARHTKWMKFMYPRLQMMKAMVMQTAGLRSNGLPDTRGDRDPSRPPRRADLRQCRRRLGGR